MPGPPFLRGDRVALCTVEEDDYEFLQRNWNHPEVRPGFGWPMSLTRDAIADRVTGMSEADDEEIFCIRADGESQSAAADPGEHGRREVPVGEAFLFDLSPHRGRVELGYWVAPSHQGNGYATEAAELLVDYAFTERRLHKVVARVLAFNEGSRRIVEGLGFERVGRMRDEFYVDGEYVDADLYGLLADEWDGTDAALDGSESGDGEGRSGGDRGGGE